MNLHNKITTIALFLIFLLSFNGKVKAQVAITTDNSEPDASAILEVKSTNRGMLIPRMTTTQRTNIASLATGLLVYDNTMNSFWYHNGTTWVELIEGFQNEISDGDNDTKIHVEKTADEDIIRFDVAGKEVLGIKQNLHGTTYFSLNSGAAGNTLIGETAGRLLKSDIANFKGVANTYLGYQAGQYDTTGFANVFLGFRAGHINYSGQQNIFIGAEAGYINNQSSNIFIGTQAGYDNSSGNNNVFIGERAGYGNRGSSNVFLGNLSGSNKLGSNLLYIENTNSNTPLIYGDFANDTVKIYGTLGIKDVYHFPITDGTNGQVLKTDGSGQLTWQTNSSSAIQDSDGNTQILTEPSTNADIIEFKLAGSSRLSIKKNAHDLTLFETPNSFNNTFFGENAGAVTNPASVGGFPKGHKNSFFGTNAGKSNTEGVGNSFFGKSAGENVTSGSLNTYIGVYAGFSTTTGENNAFLGNSAGHGITTGYDNVILGSVAGLETTTGYSNVFVGFSSADSNTTGSENVAVGKEAGSSNETGSGNVFLGALSGRSNTGSGNVFLGAFSGMDETGSNKLMIDNWETSTPLIYGEFDKDFVQINGSLKTISNSARPLLVQHNTYGNGSYIEVNNSSGTRALFGVDGSGYTGGDTTDVVVTNWSNGDLVLFTDSNERMRIDSIGKIGIGRTATTNLLEVNGQASKTAAGSWVANSDARLKKNITSLSSEKMLHNLLALKGVTYEWNDTITGNNRPEGIQYGFTAQNIQTVFPTLVEEDNQGYLQTAYGTYDAMTVEAIRALHDKIERLEKENILLKAQVNKMNQQQQEMAELKAVVQAIQAQMEE